MQPKLYGRWFADAGLPLDAQAAEAAHRLAEHVERVEDWSAAVRFIQDPRTLAAWDEERLAETALKAQAERAAGPDALHCGLSSIVDEGLTLFFDAAESATRRAGLEDPYLVRVAAGAVAQAAYQAALARAAGADDHPFVQKYALFERGRWVLGTIARTLYIL